MDLHDLKQHFDDRFDRLENALKRINAENIEILRKEIRIMGIQDDLQTTADLTKSEVEQLITITGGLNAKIADLTQKLNDAINAQDMTKVKLVNDELIALNGEVSAALVSATPAPDPVPAPAPAPDPVPADPSV